MADMARIRRTGGNAAGKFAPKHQWSEGSSFVRMTPSCAVQARKELSQLHIKPLEDAASGPVIMLQVVKAEPRHESRAELLQAQDTLQLGGQEGGATADLRLCGMAGSAMPAFLACAIANKLGSIAQMSQSQRASFATAATKSPRHEWLPDPFSRSERLASTNQQVGIASRAHIPSMVSAL